MSLPGDELRVPEQEKQAGKFGRPAQTTVKLQTMAESITKIGSNLSELTSALDNLVKVTEKVTGKSLR